MNVIYLMIDEKKDFALFKVGFTSNLMQRFYSYTTHNPLANCISLVQTQNASKRKVEKLFHEEIKSMGFEFVNAKIDNKKTEWFRVEYNNPMYHKLKKQGLQAFKNGKNRKEIKG